MYSTAAWKKKKGGGQIKPEQFCDTQSIAEA